MLTDAIKRLEGHIQNQKLEEAKELLLEKLKVIPSDSYEDRGIIYYYLLRTYLQGDIHLENALLVDYYDKMSLHFLQQEKHYREDLIKAKDSPLEKKVQTMQVKAFYKLVERYFSSLEILYSKKDFYDSQQRAFLEKMRYRKHYYRLRKEYVRYGGYTIMDMSSRYGTSFGRWLVTTIVVLVFFGLTYYILDAFQTGLTMTHGGPLYDYFYFSLVTMMTVGYGDITPITGLQKLVVAFEVFGGYIMLGMLINLLSKKMR